MLLREASVRVDFLAGASERGMLWDSVLALDSYGALRMHLFQCQASLMVYSETSDISHLQDFQPSSNFRVCRVTTFEVWEIPLKILHLLPYGFQFQDIR